MAAEENQSEDKPKSSKLGALMMPILAAVNLLVVGGGAFLVFKATLGAHPPTLREPAAVTELEEQRKEGKTPEPVMYTMPGFLVNLQGSPSRLIKVEMTFEMLDKDGFEEIVRNSPAARDEIVRILNRKTFDDIESIQGKLFLKDQITVALNRSMNSGVIKDIYFNQFLVQ